MGHAAPLPPLSHLAVANHARANVGGHKKCVRCTINCHHCAGINSGGRMLLRPRLPAKTECEEVCKISARDGVSCDSCWFCCYHSTCRCCLRGYRGEYSWGNFCHGPGNYIEHHCDNIFSPHCMGQTMWKSAFEPSDCSRKHRHLNGASNYHRFSTDQINNLCNS